MTPQTLWLLLTVTQIVKGMINYIKGTIKYKSQDSLIVVTAGIGFRITLSDTDNVLLGSDVELWVKGYLKDDSFFYYGFYTESEYSVFEKLIKVDGVGPKTAMSILAKIAISDLFSYISKADYSSIKKAGISDKIAKKLVIDLANVDIDLQDNATLVSKEVVDALMNLGFAKEDVLSKLANLDLGSSEDYIKYFLKNR